MNQTPPTPATTVWAQLQNPKSRRVIYGITDRSGDAVWVRINDWMLDHQPIGLKEKSRLFHALKLLVNSGVGFLKSLEMLEKRTKNVRLSRILATMGYDMEQRGVSFSAAMAKYPDVFSAAEIKMVYSGEVTGKIEETLETIATQVEKNIQMTMQIRSALMYPITVMAAIVLAGIVVMVFIVPKLMGLFTEFGGDLPWTTQVLIGTSDALVSYWWLMGLAVLVAVMLFRQWYSSEEGRLSWDGFMLRIPALSTIVSQIQTVRIAHNFSTLMDSGIPLNKALRILADIVPNRVVANALFDAEMQIRQGEKLNQAFRNQAAFDPVLGEILEVGEKTGHIASVLQKLGDQYEIEVEAQLKNLSTIIEPLIIVVVGMAVVFIMMAVMTPIFELQSLFSES